MSKRVSNSTQLCISIVLILATGRGVLCQLSSVDGTCPGDDIPFSCVTSDTTIPFTWPVTSAEGVETVCVALRSGTLTVPTCGPMDRFTVSVSEDGSSSTLSVQSVDDILNGTRVQCAGGDVDEEICVVDRAPPTQILSARVSESDVCDDNGCVVIVEWSEPFISCAGSVSQYVLSVNPPTCDCPSSPNCVVMDGRAVYTLSGSERQHNITVNRTMSPEYGVTVRADTCDSTLTGETSSEYNISLTVCFFPAQKRVPQPFTYHYMYSITTLTINTIVVNWPRVDNLNVEAAYRVVIIPGSGSETVIDIETEDDCSGDTCSYTFSSDDITDSYSVAVEVVACTTERFTCTDISSFCSPAGLLVQLPSPPPGLSWSAMTVTTEGLGSFSFDGGSVTYDGVSQGSTATYTTSLDYHVNGSRVFQSSCYNDMWTPPAVISYEGCMATDLLPCTDRISVRSNVLCCNGSSVCVEFDGLSIGDMARYSTSSDYCIETQLVRMCTEGGGWEGATPTLSRASSEPRSGLITALIATEATFLLIGLGVAVVLTTVIVRRYTGSIQWWCWILLAISSIFTVIAIAFWLSLIGYTSSNEFTEDDGPLRMDSSACDSPSGSVRVRDALVVVCSVLSHLVLVIWLLSLGIMRCGVATNTGSTDVQSKTAEAAVTYEEVGVAGEVERSHDIQLTSNEAYGPIDKDNIQTSHNTAYGQV